MSVLQFKSYDQGRKKFQGTSQNLIHLDEEPDYEIYEECKYRILDNSGMMMLTMTPLSGITKVCQMFMRNSVAEVPKGGMMFMFMTWADNPHLPIDEIKRLTQNASPRELAALIVTGKLL